MRARGADEDEEVDVQMTPLIDCVFLLLVFFLVAATLKKPHKELELQLPQSAAASLVATRYDLLIVEMDRQGNVYIEHEPMTKQILNERLHRIAEARPDTRILVEADRRAPVQFLVRLLDHLQFVGLKNVGVRTKD
jgi:biopolymer transport protein ExbD